MKYSYDTYNVFYYVANFKSITLAANYLHVSQPAVTRQIKNLEMNLGYTLFLRTKKGLNLTFEGEKLYKDVSKAIEIFNLIESKNNEDKFVEEGVIKILSGYATTKKILLPIIVRFNQLYPNVKIFIEYYPLNEALNKLRNGEVDLLIISNDDYIEYSDIYFTPFYELHDVLVVNNDMKKNFPKKIKLDEINKYPIICKKNSIFKKFIKNLFRDKNVDLTPTWELTDYWLVEEYIKMNMGIGVVSREFIEDDIKNKNLIEIETDIDLPKHELTYAIRKNSILRPELIKLIHLFKNINN